MAYIAVDVIGDFIRQLGRSWFVYILDRGNRSAVISGLQVTSSTTLYRLGIGGLQNGGS